MGSYLQLEVVTPEGRVFSSDVAELQFPTAYNGYYGILPDHTPVLAPLGDGLISCLTNGKKSALVVFGGFAEVGPDRVRILARECQTADSMDRGAITAQLREAEDGLKGAKMPEEQQKMQSEIDKCKLKLQALEP